MSLDVHALMSIVDMSKLLKKSDNLNIQPNDLVKAIVMSEPCLFHNASTNLMPVSYVQAKLPETSENGDDDGKSRL